MALTHTTAVRTALAQEIADQVAGGSAPIIELYDGVLLCAEILMDPTTPFVAASGGETDATLPLSDASANAAGTVDNFIVKRDSGGLEIFNGSVSATGGGGDLVFSNNVFALGETINITQFTWIAPQ